MPKVRDYHYTVEVRHDLPHKERKRQRLIQRELEPGGTPHFHYQFDDPRAEAMARLKARAHMRELEQKAGLDLVICRGAFMSLG